MKVSKNNKVCSFSVRLANKNDCNQIIAVQLKSIEILSTKDYRSEQLQALLASKSCQRANREIIFVAEIRHKVIGFVALDKYINSIAGLFVDPDYVRQGIGTVLLQRIEQEAIKLKIPILWVCSSLTGYPFYLN